MTKDYLVGKTKFFMELMLPQFKEHFGDEAVVSMSFIGDTLKFEVFESCTYRDKSGIHLAHSVMVNASKKGEEDWSEGKTGIRTFGESSSTDGDYM